jgi:FKBP-type peptidyl-prolyl cis-trans isomerase FklB
VEEASKKDSGFAINPEDMPALQQRFVTKEKEKKIKVYQEATRKWMAENAKKSGISILPSKAQFKLVKAGSGSMPGYYDTVTYHLAVKTSAGKEIFDSKKRGEARSVPVFLLGLAPVEEAFQKVAEGSVFEVYVSNDAFPQMTRESSLEEQYGVSVYTITLLKVVPGKAPAPTKNAPAGDEMNPSEAPNK